LWPADPARQAEVDVFIEWFNRVWKVAPNAMAAELAEAHPDERRLDAWSDELRGWLHLFEGLLDGRDWLMAETFGAADVCAFPFLKYGVLELRSDDGDPFHRVLADHLPIVAAFPAIEAWVHRVDALPRA
jgi:glutathione S-transferase